MPMSLSIQYPWSYISFNFHVLVDTRWIIFLGKETFWSDHFYWIELTIEKKKRVLKKFFSKLDKSSMYLIGLTDISKGVKPTSRAPYWKENCLQITVIKHHWRKNSHTIIFYHFLSILLYFEFLLSKNEGLNNPNSFLLPQSAFLFRNIPIIPIKVSGKMACFEVWETNNLNKN